ncbi:MAG: hypothetical protein PF542_02205 [Nanoarchaeota archaeon]|jgi:predicted transcriptional regulator|nr:hypothetical protein [Nanoarchaeota archaeon]
MTKRSTTEIKISILRTLTNTKDCSYGELERRINTNWKTIRSQCQELELFKTINISEDNRINITKNGQIIIKESKEKYPSKNYK